MLEPSLAPSLSPRDATNAAVAAALTAIESLDAILAVADALVAAGRRVDLSGLEAEAEALCSAVLTLGPRSAAARRLRLGLECLLRRVDRLRAGLTTVPAVPERPEAATP
ncbi:MAG: hypothetical protein IRZ13_17700 [Acetobacteraceae bacterium]|nr:hypothetical protein [Acetobacteraceae bacterium]